MIYHLSSALPTWNITNQRILLRADLNVPLDGSTILNDYRLKALQPTIDYCLAQNAHVVIATHLGRPTHHDPALSTRHLLPWFTQHGYAITHQADINHVTPHQPNSLTLLENLRFFPQEKSGDLAFAQTLAAWGDYYVQDAFGALHRTDTSMTVVPSLFSPTHRTIGFLVEQELRALNTVIEHPAQPFLVLIGGGKIADKLPIIQALLNRMSAGDTIFIGPALSATFLKGLGQRVGNSPVQESYIDACREIMQTAQSRGIACMVPQDFVVAQTSFYGPLFEQPYSVAQFPDAGVAIAPGPKTLAALAPVIKKARAILFNGLMGDTRRPETLTSMRALLDAMAHSDAFTVIAGGDSVAAAQRLGYDHKISYLSTGGGATFTYISGKELPGLEPFLS